MKKFFKKIVNKVKEVFHMAVKVVKDGLEVNSETINTLGSSFVEYLENKDNIKAAEKAKVVDVVEDAIKGTGDLVKAIDRKPLKFTMVCAGLGASVICVGVFVGVSVHLANKLA